MPLPLFLSPYPFSLTGADVSFSTEQQITLYPHQDSNNDWLILNTTSSIASAPLKYIQHNDQVKLFHLGTKKRLHSHDVRPPISEVDFQQEVSGYGFAGFDGDAFVPFFCASF